MIKQSKPLFNKDDFKYIDEIISSGQIAQGRFVEKLQNRFSDMMGTRHSYAVSSGTSALHIALLSLGIKKGDEVMIPSFTCAAVLNSINYVGATPVLVDVDPETFNITRDIISKKITARTKLIIVTHTFGFPADLDEILKLGIPVLEDCAQALGSTYKRKPVGSKGIISVFSFYATKMISSGEGGMVCTNDKRLSEKILDLNNYDKRDTYQLRYNYKMSDLTAGVALNQLNKLNFFLRRRRYIAGRYKKAFALPDFKFQKELTGTVPNYYRFIIASPLAGRIIKFTNKKGVACDRPIFRPLHRYLKVKGFAATDSLWRNCISVPIYPALKNREIARIIKVIKNSI